MATYTFTGQCYSQSGDTKKYESNLWQGVSYTESTVGGVSSTSLTRSSDNINYYYTITYLPENITNGTVVTVSGSSNYAGVSKSFAFSFTGTKSDMYYWAHVSFTYLVDKSDGNTGYSINGISLHTNTPSDFTVKSIIILPTVSIKYTTVGDGDVARKYDGWLKVPQSNPTITTIGLINKTTGKITTKDTNINDFSIYAVLWLYKTSSTTLQNWYVGHSEALTWTLSETQPS